MDACAGVLADLGGAVYGREVGADTRALIGCGAMGAGAGAGASCTTVKPLPRDSFLKGVSDLRRKTAGRFFSKWLRAVDVLPYMGVVD